MESKELALKLDIGDNITSLIEKLASQIGTTADKVFPWYIKQQVIDGWMFLACSLTALIVGAALLASFYKKADMDHEGAVLGCFIGGIVALIALGAVLLGAPTAVTQIFNPEYHALKSLTADMASLIRK